MIENGWKPVVPALRCPVGKGERQTVKGLVRGLMRFIGR
jgi:hypothetical protein